MGRSYVMDAMDDASDTDPTWTNALTKEDCDAIIDAIAEKNHLPRAKAEKLFESRHRRVKRNPILDEQWVSRTHKICEAIRSGSAKPHGIFESVFWIQLYGCLTELRERFRVWRDTHVERLPPKPRRFLEALCEISAACDALHSSLSDDELVYVAFLRQVHAHVYQDGFEYDIERGNPEQGQPAALRTKQRIPTVGRHVDVDEAHAVVDRVHRQHGDEQGAATAFAVKVSADLERLDRAMKERRAAEEAASSP